MTTLTRLEAQDLLLSVQYDVVGLRWIARHWDVAGHWNESDHVTAEQWFDALTDHVEYCASSDDTRSNGPSDDDDTGLPALAE